MILIRRIKKRKWKWEAKDKEALLKDASRGPKEGTYKTGVVMKSTEGSAEKKVRKKRKSNPCDCGGSQVHYYRSSKFCLKAKPKNKMAVGKPASIK